MKFSLFDDTKKRVFIFSRTNFSNQKNRWIVYLFFHRIQLLLVVIINLYIYTSNRSKITQIWLKHTYTHAQQQQQFILTWNEQKKKKIFSFEQEEKKIPVKKKILFHRMELNKRKKFFKLLSQKNRWPPFSHSKYKHSILFSHK